MQEDVLYGCEHILMRRILAIVALVLALGYTVTLFPLPWGSENLGAEAEFIRNSWILGLALLVLNLVGAVLLLRLRRGWLGFAIAFCLAQVVAWWLLSGVLVAQGDFVQFLSRKVAATWALLHHPDTRIVFVTLHQEIVGAFYHLALLGLLINVLVGRAQRTQAT